MIERKKYIEQIKPYIGKEIIKVLVGARRVGKTTILQQLSDFIKNQDKNANIIYINKEYHEFKNIIDNNDLYDFISEKINPQRTNHIFIDEIQEIKNFETTLRELLVKKHDIYCTGSNAKMLSGDLATLLSGRYIEFEINPLSYNEFLQFHQLSNSNESLNKYIKYGGLPYLYNLELDDRIVYDYLKSIYNTIILKDVVSRFNIREIDFLERLIDYLADNLGSYVSSTKINDFLKSQKIKLSVNTVLNYLNYLSSSFFVKKLKRYDIIGKKYFEVNDKYYFLDLGLKHAIIPYKVNDIGKILENLVCNKLIEEGYNLSIGKLGSNEIDFIAKRRDEKLYVQVSYLLSTDKVKEREFGNLLQINDNYEKIVVSADEFAGGNYKGIKHLNIKDFLITQK